MDVKSNSNKFNHSKKVKMSCCDLYMQSPQPVWKWSAPKSVSQLSAPSACLRNISPLILSENVQCPLSLSENYQPVWELSVSSACLRLISPVACLRMSSHFSQSTACLMARQLPENEWKTDCQFDKVPTIHIKTRPQWSPKLSHSRTAEVRMPHRRVRVQGSAVQCRESTVLESPAKVQYSEMKYST